VRSRGNRREKEDRMLFWNEDGQVECERHTPFRGSDMWLSGRWRPISMNERISFAAELGRPVSCDSCRAIADRHREGRHAERKSNECALCAECAS
jgi:hypothetical protein